jgi:carbon monoxide dehydrogenase subunit G
MELSGDYKFKAPLDKVWETLLNKEALQKSLPGCESFTEMDTYQYEATLKVGVAAIKGTYHAKISMADIDVYKHYKLLVEGAGGSGFLNGEGAFDLTEEGEGSDRQTSLHYTGKANVGGTLAGIGARMLSPVAKKMAGDFFKSMDKIVQETISQLQSDGVSVEKA